MISKTPSKIKEVLTRGVVEIITRQSLEKKLKQGKKLRIKHGVDPTTPDLHLGHAVVYEKLRAFQELGHKIVFLIGDFTGRFGDPTERLETRALRAKKEVRALAKGYLKQAGKILDIKKTEVRYNSEWYDKMSAEELLHLMSNFTVSQMLQRSMFQKRLEKGKEIGLHEPVYPVLQAYDSVMLKSDLTVIGTDQIFNELQARPLQEKFGQKPQDILAMPLLIGIDGRQKMSQSLGNHIGITEPPSEQYGKIMSMPDSLILPYFELVTRLPLIKLKKIKQALKKGRNPKIFKARLAREIVSLYHGPKASQEAEKEFTRIFQKGQLPAKIKTKKIKPRSYTLPELLVKVGLAVSRSEAKRVIDQGGIRINGQRAKDWNLEISPKRGTIIQRGKRKFIKVIF